MNERKENRKKTVANDKTHHYYKQKLDKQGKILAHIPGGMQLINSDHFYL